MLVWVLVEVEYKLVLEKEVVVCKQVLEWEVEVHMLVWERDEVERKLAQEQLVKAPVPHAYMNLGIR